MKWIFSPLLILILLLSATTFAKSFAEKGMQTTGKGVAIHPDAWTTPYNKLTQLACHNCYEPEYGELYQFGDSFSNALDYVTAVEMDVWDSWNFLNPFSTKMEGNWYVRHHPYGGNHSNCSGDGSLEFCLRDLADWSEKHPKHFPVTVFIDKKQNWSTADEKRSPESLFMLLEKTLGNKLFTPGDHYEYNEIGNETPKVWKWPKAEELKGKIVVVINGGSFVADKLTGLISPLSTYNTLFNHESINDLSKSRAFVGPYVFNPEEFKLPVNMSHSVAFINMKNSSAIWKNSFPLQTDRMLDGRIIRIWGSDNESFCEQLKKRVNFAAYYNITEIDCDGYQVLPHRAKIKKR